MEFNSRRSIVTARNGMISTSQPLVSVAGLRVLLGGGNAVDAAVAAAAVLNVVEPGSTGVGGDLFALVRTSNDGKVHALNASGRSPAAASLDELRDQGMAAIPRESAYAVTVPGAVSGWAALLERFGTMALGPVLEPAIQYASNGYPVSKLTSSQWGAGAHKLLAWPSGHELLKDGRAPGPGEVVRLPELARTLKTIGDGGAAAFYRGPLAGKIAGYVQRHGGWLSEQDMAEHQPTWEEPIYTDYRGVRCWECPPNTQGLHVLMALNLAEALDIESMEFQSADAYHHMIECVRLAFADGMHHITDPNRMVVATEELLSKGYADRRRKLINPDKAMHSISTGLPASQSDTVYLSCVDSMGNACSLINSLYTGFGTGLVVPGTGIALQNRGASFSLVPDHPNALEPNKRPFHTLIPGMATRDGELWLSYGVMGTVQQAQGHFQVLVNMIDHGLDPQAALDAPRFSVRPGEGVAVEDRVPTGLARELRRRGHQVLVRPPDPLMFGGGQIIERDSETGVLRGGSEPRQDGCAIGW